MDANAAPGPSVAPFPQGGYVVLHAAVRLEHGWTSSAPARVSFG